VPITQDPLTTWPPPETPADVEARLDAEEAALNASLARLAASQHPHLDDIEVDWSCTYRHVGFRNLPDTCWFTYQDLAVPATACKVTYCRGSAGTWYVVEVSVTGPPVAGLRGAWPTRVYRLRTATAGSGLDPAIPGWLSALAADRLPTD
jgi:hypothetical protein